MSDVYSIITEVEDDMLERIADVLELRAADPQQKAMRDSYWAEVEFPKEARVLEVGCGTGAVSRALAAWPGVGEVVGVDPSPVFLEKARYEASGIENLSFEEADGRSLPFDNSSFDATVMHTLLCHVPEPEGAVAEAFRVLRPGGWAAFFDGDYATTTVSIGDFDPLQACADATIAGSVHDRWLIRRFPTLARKTGFEVTSFRSHGYSETSEPVYMLTVIDRGADLLATQGRITTENAEALKAEARRRAEAGEFFGHITYASLIARKP
jgi:ubiquinone/menaquinone biosynthesis C-methylase UbiE